MSCGFYITAAAVALLPLSLGAAEVAKQGSDTLTAFWVTTSSSTIQQGSRSLTIYEFNGITRNDAGNPMFDFFGQRCLGVYKSLGGNDRNDLGTCTYTDKDGDQIFEHYPVGKIVNGQGRSELIGGTGKYMGITGTTEFVAGSHQIKADDKMFRNAVHIKATWKLP